jgi:hypothetical protein
MKGVPIAYHHDCDGKCKASKLEGTDMNILLSPVLANLYYVGGGSLGTLLLIVVVVMLLRR